MPFKIFVHGKIQRVWIRFVEVILCRHNEYCVCVSIGPQRVRDTESDVCYIERSEWFRSLWFLFFFIDSHYLVTEIYTVIYH